MPAEQAEEITPHAPDEFRQARAIGPHHVRIGDAAFIGHGQDAAGLDVDQAAIAELFSQRDRCSSSPNSPTIVGKAVETMV